MTPRILVQNRQRKIRVDLLRLRTFAERALHECRTIPSPRHGKLSRMEEVGIVLISDQRMARMHRQYLGVDGPTDVITFQHGEVFISVETARRQARVFGASTHREVELYLIHGLLHLHGFDDTTEPAAKEMFAMQKRIVTRLAAGPATRDRAV